MNKFTLLLLCTLTLTSCGAPDEASLGDSGIDSEKKNRVLSAFRNDQIAAHCDVSNRKAFVYLLNTYMDGDLELMVSDGNSSTKYNFKANVNGSQINIKGDFKSFRRSSADNLNNSLAENNHSYSTPRPRTGRRTGSTYGLQISQQSKDSAFLFLTKETILRRRDGSFQTNLDIEQIQTFNNCQFNY